LLLKEAGRQIVGGEGSVERGTEFEGLLLGEAQRQVFGELVVAGRVANDDAARSHGLDVLAQRP
jgi:hypothetical protein